MRLEESSVDRARRRLIEMHYRARVGHLGGNLSCIDATMLVHHEVMRRQDRFVLSKGHSAGALYVTLWSLGHLSDADLDTFHKDDTLLGGHPPPRGIPGILFGTGSLGHGLSLAAGLAMAARLQRTDRRVYCLTSDGEWQEGSTLEAAIFASHNRLNNLVVLIDHNGLQGFGTTQAVASMSPLQDRLSGFDLEIRVCDGHDLASMRQAMTPTPSGKPLVVVMNTIKGHGVAEIEGTVESHYLPLTPAQFANAMASFEVTA